MFIKKITKNTGGMCQKTAMKIAHNKPDLIIWNRESKICSVIEFSSPLDININKKVNEKLWSTCLKFTNNVPRL